MSNSKSIFDIEKQFLEVISNIEDNNGDVTEEELEKLKLTEEEFDNKVEGYVHVIKEYEAKLEMIQKETRRLRRRKMVFENIIDRLQETIDQGMTLLDKSKIEYPTFTLSYRRSESVEIEDESLIPKEYMRETVKLSPDKRLISDRIKEGDFIEGARIVEKQNLQIR